VLAIAAVPERFHARHDAVSKLYAYRILNRPMPGPLAARFTWHLRAPLDVRAMAAGARLVLGTHDFSAFRGAPGGPPEDENPRRSLDRLDVIRQGDEVRIEAEGRSFLRHMVRNLVGTLVEVGQGRRPADDMAKVLDSRERANAGPTAPAHGLCLERVAYADEAR
jgi:tRNA pseudouridine38-40 synthase